MSSKRDYYEILELKKSATHEEIKKAYRELALRHHPDRVAPEKKKEAEEWFKEMSEAYAVLSDPKKRALYDQYGHSGIDQKYAYEDVFKGTDFTGVFEGMGDFGLGGSFFENLFGDLGADMFRSRRRGRQPGASSARGRDIELAVAVTLEEARLGAEKAIGLPRYDTCAACGGSGTRQDAVKTTCPDCGGQGKVRTTRQLSVTIPPGVDDGSRLRVKGEGEAGPRGRGDLFVVVEMRSHGLFERDGSDLFAEISVSPAEAVLGAEKRVPTLEGSVVMRIPPGTQSGTVFRLKGKGMPKLRESGTGDELVKLSVSIPTRLSPRQRELFEELARLEGELPAP